MFRIILFLLVISTKCFGMYAQYQTYYTVRATTANFQYVGVGTNNPSCELEVVGTIKATTFNLIGISHSQVSFATSNIQVINPITFIDSSYRDVTATLPHA